VRGCAGSPPLLRYAFFAVVLLALLLRLIGLDTAAFGPSEGPRALAAWQLVNGKIPDWWEAPALAGAVAGSFILMGDSEVAARLLPALAGAGTVLALALLRGWLGWWPVLAGAQLAALSPSGLALARSVAEDTIAALITLLMGWALIRYWDQRRAGIGVLMGIGAAALVHLGYAGVTGAITLIVFALAWSSVRPQRAWQTTPAWLRESLFPFGAAFVLISTGGLLYLDGFSLPSLASWARHFEGLTGDQPWFQAGLVMVGYEPAALLLGLPAAFLALWRWRLRLGEPDAALLAFLSIWALMGLVFPLLGGTADATSVYASALPLSVLGGYLLARGIAEVDKETLRRFAWGLPLVAACSVFAGINILRAASEAGTATGPPWLALAALVLPLATAPALAAGSPRPAALLACFVGVAAVLLSVHGISRLRAPWPGQISGQSQAVQTLRDLTRLKPYTTSGQGFFALVQQDLRPVAGWHLRDLRSVTYAGQVARGPALLIGEAGSSPSDIPGYQRRVVPVVETWTPSEWGLAEMVRWIATGDVPPRSRISRRAAVYVSQEAPA